MFRCTSAIGSHYSCELGISNIFFKCTVTDKIIPRRGRKVCKLALYKRPFLRPTPTLMPYSFVHCLPCVSCLFSEVVWDVVGFRILASQQPDDPIPSSEVLSRVGLGTSSSATILRSRIHSSSTNSSSSLRNLEGYLAAI